MRLHEASPSGFAPVQSYLAGLQSPDDVIDIVRVVWEEQLADTDRLLSAYWEPAPRPNPGYPGRVTAHNGLRAIPTEDRAWLVAALCLTCASLGHACSAGPVAALGADLEAVADLQRAELPAGTALVVRTSGSSGVPKAVALSAQALRASAAATTEALGGAGQWLVCLPTHLISGLQMLVRSGESGTLPVFFDGGFEGGFSPERLLQTADTLEADRRCVSLVPVQFSRLLDLAERDRDAADALRRFDAVLVGGQGVSLALRRRAHELGVALKRSYGMTETAGGCVYDGVEIGDTRVRIRDGEVQLAGSALALGYVGDPELTAQRFVTQPDRGGQPVRWYRTGDAGELLGGMLTVTGRLDRVLISGGVNVSLDEVERVVHELPGWSGAVAVSGAHAEWGERVCLVAETAEMSAAGAAGVEEVRSTIRNHLGPAAVPEWITAAEAIPRLAGGKADLRAIANLPLLGGVSSGGGNPARRAAAVRKAQFGESPRITWRSWVGGARLRTLPLAVAPVAAGAGIAHMVRGFSLPLTLLALAVAVFLQVGVNYANDYSDGIRGTDAFRVGPARLTGSGLVNPKRVLALALIFFALAAVAGLVAVVLSGRWWFLALGVVAILAAWFYTGGKRPYGYAGLGEVMVFIFFGLVATVGTVWLQTSVQVQEAWFAGSGVGLFAVAVLVVNNLRDIATDRLAGKRTLAVRMGSRATRALYIVCVLLPFAVPALFGLVNPGMVLSWFVLLLVIPAVIIVITARTPRELIIVLQLTSFAALAYGVLIGIGFAF
ncbi:hypothetical protein FQR65_LT20533 [Abscondita terminalis]|nr:hypothetical protein FQR65_LT20533 [Abscondita terminalis]